MLPLRKCVRLHGKLVILVSVYYKALVTRHHNFERPLTINPIYIKTKDAITPNSEQMLRESTYTFNKRQLHSFI